MSATLELVKKNFKNLLRAKSSSLIVILGPLIVILLAGMAFDTSSVYTVKIGAFTPDESNVTRIFLDQLYDKFEVIEYGSQDDCKEAIKSSQVNACMVFAKNFKLGIKPRNEIKFFVDYSRMNLVWAIMNVVNKQVSEKSLAASEDLTKALLQTIEYTQERIDNQRESVITLTTQNELFNTNTQDLLSQLGDINLQFDDGSLSTSNLITAKTQLKQWVDNSLKIGERGLNEALGYIDASNPNDAELSAALKASVEDISRLRADFAKTKNLTGNAFNKFEGQINNLVAGLTETKGQLDEANTQRQVSVRVLESMDLLLDKSLISVLSVQMALNDIEAKIDSIEITDAKGIAQPIVTTVKPIVQEKSYLNYLFPVLIVLVIMFTALLMTPTLILLDKNSSASFRSYMTPVSDFSYVLANFLTSFLILFIQVMVILAIVGVFFETAKLASVPLALFLLLLINALFILLGMIVGYMFKSEETATLAAVSLGAVFLFISDVIVPLESMPKAFGYIASFNPYVIASSLLRRALVFDASFLSMVGDVVILVGYVAGAAIIAVGMYEATKNHALEDLMRKIRPVLTKVRLRRRK